MSLFIGPAIRKMLAYPEVRRASRLQKEELNKKINVLVDLMNNIFNIQNHVQYGNIKIYDGASSHRKLRLLPSDLPKDSKVIVFETFDRVRSLLVVHADGAVNYSCEIGMGLSNETYDIDSVIEARKQEYEELQRRSAAA